ncbi:MAG: DUF4344 domain-containing metallopeptidase [Planctomycetota bacterium]
MNSCVIGYVAFSIAICTGHETIGPPNENELTPFAENVTLHVVLHELGHALVREFDLPVLGNEETMADAFATCYLTQHMPERAYDVIEARVRSLMTEANEVPPNEWTVQGEHNNDARRAIQIAALAVAAHPDKYAPIAKLIGMNENKIEQAADYGTEIHRSWRRILRPIFMPDQMRSTETQLKFDPSSKLAAEIRSANLTNEIKMIIKRFDWHSQITVLFSQGDGSAGWSRGKRTITVKTGYVRRFIRQGQLKLLGPSSKRPSTE